MTVAGVGKREQDEVVVGLAGVCWPLLLPAVAVEPELKTHHTVGVELGQKASRKHH